MEAERIEESRYVKLRIVKFTPEAIKKAVNPPDAKYMNPVYKQRAELNEQRLNRLAPDLKLKDGIVVKTISKFRRSVLLRRGKQSYDYYLGSGTYFNRQTNIVGKIPVASIPKLFDFRKRINNKKSCHL